MCEWQNYQATKLQATQCGFIGASGVKAERGTSEVSCVIDQDAMGYLKAIPLGHTADSRPNAFTFANMAAQTDKFVPQVTTEIPDELKQTIGNHLWLAKLEATATRVCLSSLRRCLFVFLLLHPQNKLSSFCTGRWHALSCTNAAIRSPMYCRCAGGTTSPCTWGSGLWRWILCRRRKPGCRT